MPRMCRTMTVSVVALGSFTSLPAAADARGQIQLRGVVPAMCTVAIVDSGTNLDLVRGQALVPVASVQEQCNSASGYTVTVASRNGGELRRDGSNSGVGYTLHYGGASGTGTIAADRAVSGEIRQNTLAVSLPPTADIAAGIYVDVVTISVAAK